MASDFLSGYLMEPDGGLKKLFPNYGRKDLSRQWVFWRLVEDGSVCMLDLSLDRLFVTRDDLLVLMGEGDEPSVAPPVRKEKKPRASSAGNADVPDTGSGGGQVVGTVDQTYDGQVKPVIAESCKTVAAKVQKSTEPVEAAPKPGPRGPTILRLKQVMERTGLSRSTIYDRMNPNSPRHDPRFPKQVSLGGDAVGWIEDEIFSWVQARVVAGRT